jgi:sugar O-acyltransferase (sialic acid O-acetyltransferase NeuD family)
MADRIFIYGAGGFGREVALLLRQCNGAHHRWDIAGFLDDGVTKGSVVDGLKVHGGAEELKVMEPASLVIAVADPSIRMKIVLSLPPVWKTPPVVHPLCNVGDGQRNRFGRGCILAAGSQFTTGVNIGEFVIVNLNCTVGHDVELGSFCSVMPGAHLSGNVRVGEVTLVGTGAMVLQNLTIGKGCRVGAGAVVTRSLGDGVTAVGIPARAVQLS